MKIAESLGSVERVRESILLLNQKSVGSTICNLVNETILEHRVKAMCFRRT